MLHRFIVVLLLAVVVSQSVTPAKALQPVVTTPRRHNKNEPLTQLHALDGVGDDTSKKSAVYRLLSTPRDCTPGRGTFLYNDEVISHLHGYMLLVGLFGAADEMFLSFFFIFASIAAGATQVGAQLPANPRVPGAVAAATLAATWFVRYGLNYELMLFADGLDYKGPAEAAMYFEAAICALNVGWGFWGSWRTKEQVKGATYGF